jgi:hypothetical protein
MPATVTVNERTVVHRKSDGVATAFPDVCKTPGPGGAPLPIPYPNVAQSQDTALGSITVQADGCPVMLQGSVFAKSTGDEAGVAGGMLSLGIMGQAEFINYSFDVKIEGKCVPRLADLMVQNKHASPNTAPFPELQPPNVAVPLPLPIDDDDEEYELVSLDEACREDES